MMKKIISVLLVCVMLLSLGVSVAATDTEDLTVEQIARLYKDTLEGGTDETGVYTGIINANTNTTDYSGTLKVAHDGDYLYLVSLTTYDYSNRTNVEMHLYIDFGDITYQIVALPNYAVYKSTTYGNSKGNINYYVEDATSTYVTDSNYYYRFGVYTENPTEAAVATNNALDYGILCGLNYANSSTNAANNGGGHEVVIPMPESLKNEIRKNGEANIKVGFTYMLNGNSSSYITSGSAPTETPSNWRAWANADGAKACKDVTLKGASQSTATNVDKTKFAGFQTTEIGETGSTYSVRFLATLNTSDLAKERIGFYVSGDMDTMYVPCSEVYSSVMAEDYGIPAWWLGGDYIFLTGFSGLEVGLEYTFTINTYHYDEYNNPQWGTYYTVNVAADGEVTITEQTNA